MKLELILVYLMVVIATANAQCCWDDPGDGSFCGGVGPCNFACCNCRGGCKPGGEGFSSKNEKKEKEIFDKMDQNHDGFITFEDILHYRNPGRANNTNLSVEHKWYNSKDKDHDGKLNLKEFEALN